MRTRSVFGAVIVAGAATFAYASLVERNMFTLLQHVDFSLKNAGLISRVRCEPNYDNKPD